MKERSIILTQTEVLAILAGNSTQLRRPIKPQPTGYAPARGYDGKWWWNTSGDQKFDELRVCPFGEVGTRLRGREAVCLRPEGYGYKAGNDPDNNPKCWCPASKMPRKAARIFLEVTRIRVRRMRWLNEKDANRLGFRASTVGRGWWQGYYYSEALDDLVHCQTIGDEPPDWMIEPKKMKDRTDLDISAKQQYIDYWNSIYAKRGLGYDTNCWQWVVDFKRVEGN